MHVGDSRDDNPPLNSLNAWLRNGGYQIKSNFIYMAHFIPGGNTMRFTEGIGRGGYKHLYDTQVFQRDEKTISCTADLLQTTENR